MNGQTQPITTAVGLVAYDRYQGNRRGVVTEECSDSPHYVVRDRRWRFVLALVSRTRLERV